MRWVADKRRLAGAWARRWECGRPSQQVIGNSAVAANQEKTGSQGLGLARRRDQQLRDAAASALLPESWQRDFPDLIGGFGDRLSTLPPSCVGATRQVHQTRLVHVSGEDVEPGDCDGLVVTKPELFVGIRTADCVPVLLAAASGEGSGRRRWAAAVHAGWRGTVAGIAALAVEAAVAQGFRLGAIRVALGPAIGVCCYEVGDDVARPFERLGAVSRSDTERPHVDLMAANLALLQAVGIDADQVERIGGCTRCQADRYYSYRANPQEAGRQWSWLGWVDPTRRRDPSGSD